MAYLIQNRDHPVVWRGPLKHSAISQFISEVEWGPLDFFIIDLPPGTGDEPLSVAHLIKSVDGSIVVTTPQDVALLDSRKSVNFSRVLQIPVFGIVENMSGMKCPHCGKDIPLFKIGGGEIAARELNVPFLGRIPIDPEMVQKCDSGMPYVMSYPDSEATKAIREIAQRCKEYTESKPTDRMQSAQSQLERRGGVTMKRIALACDDDLGLEGQMSAHFGRCPFYTLVDVEDVDIVKTEVVANPYYNQHQPGVVPHFINTKGAKVMIAGGMGPRAIDMFNGFGIEVATGAMGKVGNVVAAYLKGEISGVQPCEEHHGH
jgi:predicted Fe-Mo cluster-binding NifX family protein